jgi:hypothetical protein
MEKSIGHDQLNLASVLLRTSGEEAANGVNGLAVLADDARHVSAGDSGGEDILPRHFRVGNEDLVGMTGEAAEDEVEELLHDRWTG